MCYRGGMSPRTELRTLKRLIAQADEIVSSPSLSQSSSARCHEALLCALAIADNLIEQTSRPAIAAQLGQTGGKKTALKGSAYFRQLAAKRKTFGGGRPKNES